MSLLDQLTAYMKEEFPRWRKAPVFDVLTDEELVDTMVARWLDIREAEIRELYDNNESPLFMIRFQRMMRQFLRESDWNC